MASDKVHVFNDLNFEQEVLKSNVPVLVDFTATWCGPCKALAPIVDQLANDLDGTVKVGKLDIDDSPITAGKGLTTKAKLTELVKV
jgi:thioredoxin 1